MDFNLYAIRYTLYATLIAYLLDLIFGDPRWLWHPVRIIGRFIARLEKKLNREKFNKRFCGAALVALTTGLAALCVWSILESARRIHPALYFILYAAFVFFALSIKDLAVEAGRVKLALEAKNIQEARKNLSLIVGRDTDRLNEPEIIRASVETVAESAMDGIVAPLFYCFLGGPVWMWIYKAVNTLDSMVGYNNERFKEFGMASANLDGIMNLIPARLTAFLIAIAGGFYAKDMFGALRCGFRYFLKGPGFNSQMPEGAMAGALGVQLGGENFYNGVCVRRPLIGERLRPLEISHIAESIAISYICSALAVISGIALAMTMGRR